ncbi:MAG: chemotaxis protein CheW [Clostridiales Family XIII bacterium]|jgi:purine-binding chemotaxis protein CheW|nr:chemotaxis protein CheW [Clostridiales Family XIII bacterium]
MTTFLDEEEYEEEDTQRGRYLTFTLEDNVYGLPIRFVTEIIGIQTATRVPETPDYVKGIINLRGRIIPLVDVRLKFGKEEIPYNERTCIIVIDVNSVPVGLIVDKVDDVLTIEDEQIALPPEGGKVGFENRYIEGIGKIGDTVQLLLDAEKLLRTEEMQLIESIASSEN